MLDAGGFLETSALCGKPGMPSEKSSKRPDIVWGAAGRSYLKTDPFSPVVVSWRSRRKSRREAESQAAWEVRKSQEVCG